MRKKLISVIVCIVLLGGLLGAYYFTKNEKEKKDAQISQEEKDKAANANKSIKLIERKQDEVRTFTIKTENQSLTFVPNEVNAETKEITWVLVGNEDVSMINYNVEDMARGLYLLNAEEKVMDKATNLADYGLENPKSTGTIEFKDGSKETVYVGNLTPAKDYYYLMVAGNEALYLVPEYTGKRFYYTMNDLVDKTLPNINIGEALQYASIKQRGMPEIELKFSGTSDERKAEMEQYGIVSLSMTKPYPGREFYLSNFAGYVLKDTSGLKLNELVELKPTDYSKYGLNDPSLEVNFEDIQGKMHLIFGNDADENFIYCKFADKPYVFIMEKSAIATLFNINVFKFMERFTALVNIEDAASINIKSSAGNYDITFEPEQLPPEGEAQVGETLYHPKVNGTAVQEAAFKTYYASLIGLAYDAEIESFAPTGEPYLTVTYNMNEKSGKKPIVTKYYEYNKDFYALQRDDNPIQFAVNKQSVNSMYVFMNDLLAGKLDK